MNEKHKGNVFLHELVAYTSICLHLVYLLTTTAVAGFPGRKLISNDRNPVVPFTFLRFQEFS